jgi:hypothetical protein
MSDTVKIKMHVGTGFAGASHKDEHEVEREWWESLSEKDQDKFLDEIASDFLHNCVECSAWVVEDEDGE